MGQREPVTLTATAVKETEMGDVTTSRDSSSSCHHSNNQLGTRKVDMAGPKHEVFVHASHVIGRGTSHCHRAPCT